MVGLIKSIIIVFINVSPNLRSFFPDSNSVKVVTLSHSYKDHL